MCGGSIGKFVGDLTGIGGGGGGGGSGVVVPPPEPDTEKTIGQPDAVTTQMGAGVAPVLQRRKPRSLLALGGVASDTAGASIAQPVLKATLGA